MEQMRHAIEASIQAVKDRLEREKTRELVSWQAYPVLALRVSILEAARKAYGASPDILGKLYLELPPEHVKADLVFSAYPLAKSAGKKPADIAGELASVIKEMPFVASADALNGYVNIALDEKAFYSAILANALSLGASYGAMDVYKGKTVLIDYSSPNIAKPIGIGHMRSTMIGQALGNIYAETGYSVVRDNHLGDWGTQFGSLIAAYKKWGDEKALEADPIPTLKDLYVRFNAETESHPELKDEARDLFAKLEAGDPELVALWEKFYRFSLAEFDRTYERLGVAFDTEIGESYFLKEADGIVDALIAKGIGAKTADGAIAVEGLKGLPSFLLRKSDGSSLYIARDLAAIEFRAREFHPDKVLYVVGSEQNLNFKQLIAVAEAAGLSAPGALEHIGFGLVMKDGKRMSTRKGTLVELDQVLDEAVAKSREVIAAKGKDIAPGEADAISSIVGVGSVVYNDLRQSRLKNIQFDWERMLDFEAGSAVYLQYTYARIQSIIVKAGAPVGAAGPFEFTDHIEFELARLIALFPEILLQAVDFNETHLLASYLEQVAGAFNSFYASASVLGAPSESLVASRLALIQSVATVIGRGLSLLNIKIPPKL